MNRKFKRDNWTTQEVIDLIEGQILVDGNGEESESVKDINDGVRQAAEIFYDFLRPVEEMGAMAYEVNEKIVYHVGQIPEELLNREPVKRHNKEAN